MNVEYYLCYRKRHVNKQCNKYCKCNIPFFGLKICSQLALFVKVVNYNISQGNDSNMSFKLEFIIII